MHLRSAIERDRHSSYLAMVTTEQELNIEATKMLRSKLEDALSELKVELYQFKPGVEAWEND